MKLGGRSFRSIGASFYNPLCNEQNPSFFQASGSPQSQQPEHCCCIKIRWPLWFPFSKHSWQIMQVESISQSKHLKPLSDFFNILPHTCLLAWPSCCILLNSSSCFWKSVLLKSKAKIDLLKYSYWLLHSKQGIFPYFFISNSSPS